MKVNRLVIILAAALLVVLGIGSYLLSTGKLTSEVPFETSIKNTEVQSDSDEVSDIEADLNQTDVEGIDKELDDIEVEVNSSY